MKTKIKNLQLCLAETLTKMQCKMKRHLFKNNVTIYSFFTVKPL